MGTISLETASNLYWLGRNTERCSLLIDIFSNTFDSMLDKDNTCYIDLCEEMGIPNTYVDGDDFIKRFIFDDNNSHSIISNLDNAYNNAVLSKDVIKHECYSYLRLASNLLRDINTKQLYRLLNVQDNIFSFFGSILEYMEDEVAYNIVLMGKYIERIDIFMRLGEDTERIDKMYHRLNRIIPGNKFDIGKEEYDLQYVNSPFERYCTNNGL